MKKILIFLSSIIIYILLINFFASIPSINLYGTTSEKIEGGAIEVKVSDSVGVNVLRNRWYGRIIETHNKDTTTSYLYIFKIVKLPLMVNNINYVYVHLLFILILITIFSILSIFKKEVNNEINI